MHHYAIYMGKIYTIREACDILQIDATTLRRWDREGKIHCIRLSNNFRRVPEEEINRILGIKNNRIDAIYARVSSNNNKNDLYNQINRLKSLYPNAQIFSIKSKPNLASLSLCVIYILFILLSSIIFNNSMNPFLLNFNPDLISLNICAFGYNDFNLFI